ncbi:hypothetical protein BKA83DRAFT_4130184 [Pisolithus microcarpus]|nr:hypothetical protein BKA83DRAFT_4130184 [Pisolithus microcarpus]
MSREIPAAIMHVDDVSRHPKCHICYFGLWDWRASHVKVVKESSCTNVMISSQYVCSLGTYKISDHIKATGFNACQTQGVEVWPQHHLHPDGLLDQFPVPTKMFLYALSKQLNHVCEGIMELTHFMKETRNSLSTVSTMDGGEGMSISIWTGEGEGRTYLAGRFSSGWGVAGSRWASVSSRSTEGLTRDLGLLLEWIYPVERQHWGWCEVGGRKCS